MFCVECRQSLQKKPHNSPTLSIHNSYNYITLYICESGKFIIKFKRKSGKLFSLGCHTAHKLSNFGTVVWPTNSVRECALPHTSIVELRDLRLRCMTLGGKRTWRSLSSTRSNPALRATPSQYWGADFHPSQSGADGPSTPALRYILASYHPSLEPPSPSVPIWICQAPSVPAWNRRAPSIVPGSIGVNFSKWLGVHSTLMSDAGWRTQTNSPTPLFYPRILATLFWKCGER